MAAVKKTVIEEKLSEIHRQEEEQQAKNLAEKLNLPYINLSLLPIDGDALLLINEETARKANMAVINQAGKNLKIAVRDPQNQLVNETLERLQKKGLTASLFIASEHSLKKALDYYKKVVFSEKRVSGQVEITSDLLAKLAKNLPRLSDIKQKIQEMEAAQDEATHILEIIIAGALQNDASDSHLEGKEAGALLRYRIDGTLHDVVFLSPSTYQLITSRIKLLSGMVLNIREKAQDGRFTITVDKTAIEVRVSIIPGPYGENTVMRFLNPKSINLKLEDLGFRKDMLDFIRQEIQRPNGMIITTGPTGSGKTTALYAFLREVVRPEIKIITLEDPIEYHLEGVTQTQVESERGYTFAAGLRAILRQDPDVILVGEIRDKETTEIAVQSALTGHIVFSTLHTNDAAGAIPRFIDLGANPTTLSAALIDVMAQRLLRRVCPDCKKAYEPNSKEREKIENVLKNLPKTVMAPDISKGYRLYRGQGCPKCNETGYKGRIGVYELIPIDTEMEKLITKSPSHAEVLELAKKKEFVSMYQDGIIKALNGITTLEELEDIVGKE